MTVRTVSNGTPVRSTSRRARSGIADTTRMPAGTLPGEGPLSPVFRGRLLTFVAYYETNK
jgi:hypothetical protein